MLFCRRSDEDEDKNRSDDIVRKKCHDDDRFCDWKYGRERRGRSMERYSDNRHRSDKHGHGREVDSVVQGRSSGRGQSRERSRDRYSNKEKEHRSHYYKEVSFVAVSKYASKLNLISFSWSNPQFR